MGMSDPIDISPSQRKELLGLITRYLPNVEVWAFGSRVKWTARSNSDLDLVAFAKPEDEGRVSRLKEAFEDSSLPFRVDLLVWDNIPDSFRKNIKKHYVVLVGEEKTGRDWDMTSESELQATCSLNYPKIRLGDALSFVVDNRGKTPPLDRSGATNYSK